MMTLTDAYAITEARSCLAALADTAPKVEASIAYERALLYLDSLVGDYVPVISSPAENDPERLLTRLRVAVGELVTYGLDGLSAELLLDMAISTAESSESL